MASKPLDCYFNASMRVCIFIEDADFFYLCECAEHHYDGAVNGLIIPGYGAVLNGEKFSRTCQREEADEPDRFVLFTVRQLSLVCKSLEMHNTDQAGRLYFHLTKILRMTLAQETHVNQKYEASPWKSVQ